MRLNIDCMPVFEATPSLEGQRENGLRVVLLDDPNNLSSSPSISVYRSIRCEVDLWKRFRTVCPYIVWANGIPELVYPCIVVSRLQLDHRERRKRYVNVHHVGYQIKSSVCVHSKYSPTNGNPLPANQPKISTLLDNFPNSLRKDLTPLGQICLAHIQRRDEPDDLIHRGREDEHPLLNAPGSYAGRHIRGCAGIVSPRSLIRDRFRWGDRGRGSS